MTAGRTYTNSAARSLKHHGALVTLGDPCECVTSMTRWIRQGEAEYDERRALFNAMIDKRPRIIAACEGPADVREALERAARDRLPQGFGLATTGDLLRASKGGSGNFGVITALEFQLHPVGPMITGGLMAWSGSTGAPTPTIPSPTTHSTCSSSPERRLRRRHQPRPRSRPDSSLTGRLRAIRSRRCTWRPTRSTPRPRMRPSSTARGGARRQSGSRRRG